MGSAIAGIVRLYTDMDPDTELYRIRKRPHPHEHDLFTPAVQALTHGVASIAATPELWARVLAAHPPPWRLAGGAVVDAAGREVVAAPVAAAPDVLAALVAAPDAVAAGLRAAAGIAKDRLASLRAFDSDAMRARPAALAAIEDVLVFLEAAADRVSRGEHPHARTPLGDVREVFRPLTADEERDAGTTIGICWRGPRCASPGCVLPEHPFDPDRHAHAEEVKP